MGRRKECLYVFLWILSLLSISCIREQALYDQTGSIVSQLGQQSNGNSGNGNGNGNSNTAWVDFRAHGVVSRRDGIEYSV